MVTTAEKPTKRGATKGALSITQAMQDWSAANAPELLQAVKELRERYYETYPPKSSDGYGAMPTSKLEKLLAKNEELQARMLAALKERQG